MITRVNNFKIRSDIHFLCKLCTVKAFVKVFCVVHDICLFAEVVQWSARVLLLHSKYTYLHFCTYLCFYQAGVVLLRICQSICCVL